MPTIVYPTDFLASDLRWGVLYELTISLELEITEIAFRSIITQLNLKFITPKVVFSALWTPQELTIYYSTDGQLPAVSQREVVSSLIGAFSAYHPEVVFEKSEGEIPGGVPLLPEKETRLFSLEWLKQGWQEVVEKISEATGLPKDSIGWIIGGSALTIILLVLWLKTKPIVIITKES